ncbi:MAG: DUF4168 domain-containing protein [Rhodospirillaceae bacterium]|jgi:hypothetical protein|nr:DUF4168 domain-containing protein [Rhodospirillaceae bacterium]MBT6118681.1 DUF4168 domain-containing protein [Rhodospirillaceae bacterium]
MRRWKTVALSTIVVLTGLVATGWAGPAGALTPVPESAGTSILHRVAEEFSASKIYAFAEAAGKVAMITQAWTPKINGAPSATAANEYKQKAVTQMQRAILGVGLTMDEYQTIGKAAKRDPMLREEINQLVDEMY